MIVKNYREAIDIGFGAVGGFLSNDGFNGVTICTNRGARSKGLVDLVASEWRESGYSRDYDRDDVVLIYE